MGANSSAPYVEVVLPEELAQYRFQDSPEDVDYFNAIMYNTQQDEEDEETNVDMVLHLLGEFHPRMILNAHSRSLFVFVMNFIRTTTDEPNSDYHPMRNWIQEKLHWVLPPTYGLGVPCTSETIDEYLLDDPHSLYRKFAPHGLVASLVDEVEQWTLPMLNSMAVICASAQSSYSGMFSVDEISKNVALFFTELRLTWTQNGTNDQAMRTLYASAPSLPWFPEELMEEFFTRESKCDVSKATSARIRSLLFIDAKQRTLRCVFPDGTFDPDITCAWYHIDATARKCLDKLETYAADAIRQNQMAKDGSSLLETWDRIYEWASECADRKENDTEEWRCLLPSTFIYETMENVCRRTANNDLSTEWATYTNREDAPVPSKMHVCYQEFIRTAWKMSPEERASITPMELERLENAVYAAKRYLLSIIGECVRLINTMHVAISDSTTVYPPEFVESMREVIADFAADLRRRV
jgi:hypothetical protein